MLPGGVEMAHTWTFHATRGEVFKEDTINPSIYYCIIMYNVIFCQAPQLRRQVYWKEITWSVSTEEMYPKPLQIVLPNLSGKLLIR